MKNQSGGTIESLTAVILAAGQGRRLEPVTLSHSKAMTPILGRPISEHIIEQLHGLGFRNFVLVTGGDDDDLCSLAEGLCQRGISIETAFQRDRLGTAHALLQARDLIRGDFLLASCDNLYPDACILDMANTFLEHRPPAVVASFRIGPGDLDRCAGVRLEGDSIIQIVEKPGEGTGPWDAVCKFFFVFSRGILDHLEGLKPSPRGEYEVQGALQRFLAAHPDRARSVFVHDFLHLTTAEDLIRIHRHFLSNRPPFRVHPEADVDDGVEIIEPVVVDRGAYVEPGASLGPYVYVGRGARIEKGAQIQDSVIYADCLIRSGEIIKNEVKIGQASGK